MKKLILSVALLMAVPSVYADKEIGQAFGLVFGQKYTQADCEAMGGEQLTHPIIQYLGFWSCEGLTPPKPYSELTRYFFNATVEGDILFAVVGEKKFENKSEGEKLCTELQGLIGSLIEAKRGIEFEKTSRTESGMLMEEKFLWAKHPDVNRFEEIEVVCRQYSPEYVVFIPPGEWKLELAYIAEKYKKDTSGL